MVQGVPLYYRRFTSILQGMIFLYPSEDVLYPVKGYTSIVQGMYLLALPDKKQPAKAIEYDRLLQPVPHRLFIYSGFLVT